MPVGSCEEGGKPGYRWGDSGKCYVYTPGNEESRARAEAAAELQGRAARAGGYEGSMSKSEDWLGKPLYDLLPPAEKSLADALIGISESFGPIDSEDSGIWVGYVGPENNEDKDIGVKCGNCALIASENGCTILSMAIHPDGMCRLAVIPPGYVETTKGSWRGSILPIVT